MNWKWFLVLRIEKEGAKFEMFWSRIKKVEKKKKRQPQSSKNGLQSQWY